MEVNGLPAYLHCMQVDSTCVVMETSHLLKKWLRFNLSLIQSGLSYTTL